MARPYRPHSSPPGKRPQPPWREQRPGPARPRPSPASKGQSHGSVPEELADAARGVRLQKVLAAAGVASKRACEEMIAQGRVTVNGQYVTALPAWVDPAHDRIEVDGRTVARPPAGGREAGQIYVILNKPRRVITTVQDERGRRGVLDLVDLPSDLPARLFPVGRLDADTSGLVLLTNDGELTHRLTHPRHGVAKRYIVSVRGRLTDQDVLNVREGLGLKFIKALRRGPLGGGQPDSVAQVRLIGYGRDRNANERTTLEVTLREGQNRAIRQALLALGYKVRRLQRVGFGALTLRGLAVGQWRLLTPAEVRVLRREAGLESLRG